MQQFLVDRSYERMRLDVFLVERLMLFSREQIQEFIKKGQASINDKVITKPHRELHFKDHVAIEVAEDVRVKPEKQKREFQRHERVASEPIPTPKEQPTIIAETPHYFIIEKPAGWLMHRDEAARRAPVIADFMVARDPVLSTVGDNPSLRPGIVHRLDKDVSGLVIIARTQAFFDHVKQQFIDKAVKKSYQALVFGHPVKDEDEIHFRIIRSKHKARMAAVPVDHPDAKTATTHFEVLERFQHSTLLKVWVETGRTNQIRVHLAAYGLPIVGDTQYGKYSPANAAVGRVMLHADYLSFFDFGGAKVEFSSPLPKVFTDLLEKARATAIKQ